MIQGKPATWSMLKFSEIDQEPKSLDERELCRIAQEEARAEAVRAYEIPGQSGDGIYALRMAQFEERLKRRGSTKPLGKASMFSGPPSLLRTS